MCEGNDHSMQSILHRCTVYEINSFTVHIVEFDLQLTHKQSSADAGVLTIRIMEVPLPLDSQDSKGAIELSVSTFISCSPFYFLTLSPCLSLGRFRGLCICQ